MTDDKRKLTVIKPKSVKQPPRVNSTKTYRWGYSRFAPPLPKPPKKKTEGKSYNLKNIVLIAVGASIIFGLGLFVASMSRCPIPPTKDNQQQTED